jgi:hypothetical protein
MASPPFTIDETIPGDSGVVSLSPTQQRSFRDNVKSWLLWEHTATGYHSFDRDTTVNRDADTTRPIGSLFFNTSLSVLQFCVQATPSYVWDTISFPPGARLLFNNTAAPPGWTKVTDAAYDDCAVRIVTGTPGGPAGDVGFSDIFAADYTISAATEEHILTTAQLAAHRHLVAVNTITNSGNPTANSSMIVERNGASDSDEYDLASSSAEPDVSRSSVTGSGEGHAHDIEIEIDIALKHANFILCEKDAYA